MFKVGEIDDMIQKDNGAETEDEDNFQQNMHELSKKGVLSPRHTKELHNERRERSNM